MKLKHLAIATTIALSLNTGKVSAQNPFLYKLDAKPSVQLVSETRPQFKLVGDRLPVNSAPPAQFVNTAQMAQLPIPQIPLPREVPVQKDHKSEWAGQIALILSVAAFALQLGRNWKVKKQEDISLQAWIASFFVDSAWAVYGFASSISTIIVSNSLALLPRAYGIYQIIRGLS